MSVVTTINVSAGSASRICVASAADCHKERVQLCSDSQNTSIAAVGCYQQEQT